MRKTYRVHMGLDPHAFHSYRDFSGLPDALAYMWAMANVQHPERCWLWQGLDGWLRNSHMTGRPLPLTLKAQIEHFIEEDNLATANP